MAEFALTAAQADALGGSTDSDTGATYPAVGESPYHTTMYRLLHRLLTIEKVINELRPYKDGDLTFGVRPGVAMDGSTVSVFDGAETQSLADDATNYVYLLAIAGAMSVASNTTGFPDPATTPHLPLATIATGTASIAGASGAYSVDDIVDCRGRALFTVIGT